MAQRTSPLPSWLGHPAFVVLYALLVLVGVVDLGSAIADGDTGRSLVGAAARLLVFVALLTLVTRVRLAGRGRSRTT